MRTSSRLISRIRAIDWDFSGSLSESAFSALHWHPCRFASQLPAALIGLLSEPGDMVLDPFVGSGTTLVEAQRLGRPSIGIDINPVACLTARAKVLRARAGKVRQFAADLQSAATDLLAGGVLTARPGGMRLVPSTVQGRKWFTAKVLDDLGALWASVQLYGGTRRVLAELAFSGILLGVCRETRHWGYVCDNSTPVDDRGGDVLDEYCRILDRVALAYDERDEEVIARYGKWNSVPVANVVQGNTVEALGKVEDDSIALVVTSPPYFGVCDYVKAQRLSMEWFGIDIEQLRQREIGARSKRHRKRAVDEYVDELGVVFEQCRRCLRPAGHLAMIIGQSKQRAPVLELLRQAAETKGFCVEADINRRVSSQRRQAPSITGEHVWLLRKE